MSRKTGALPSQMIKEMLKAGFIKGAKEENIAPASLDLTISSKVWRLEGVFQLRPNEKISDLLINSVVTSCHDLNYLLERGAVYLAELNESLSLPSGVYGYCNPKSSTGRNDVHVRVLADQVSRYDAVTPPGYNGGLWIIISPKSFPIKVPVNTALSQIRFFNDDTRLNEIELQTNLKIHKLLWNPVNQQPISYEEIEISDHDGSIILTLDLSSNPVGYRHYGHNKILNFSKRNHNPADFFEPIQKNSDRICLKEGEFYILSTREAILVPPNLAGEMVPMDERSGEFRSHHAGYIDPGWGWGQNGEGTGRQLTLEIRPFEDMFVCDGQPIAKIRFEKMIQPPDVVYDNRLISSYVRQQGPSLSKHFKNFSF